MCNCGKHSSSFPVSLPAVPGESGFVYLRYTGTDAQTEYGEITGARYPFWENMDRQLVDSRDAEKFLAAGEFEVVND